MLEKLKNFKAARLLKKDNLESSIAFLGEFKDSEPKEPENVVLHLKKRPFPSEINLESAQSLKEDLNNDIFHKFSFSLADPSINMVVCFFQFILDCQHDLA